MNIEFSTVEEARQDNPKAQTEIFETFFGYLISKGQREYALTDDAEDVAIEALTKAFKAMKKTTFASTEIFMKWVFRIHRNTAYDRGRHKLRRIRTVQFGEYPTPTPSYSRSVDAETRDSLEFAFKLLADERPRDVALLLAHTKGESDQRLAETYNIPLGTVKSIIWRTKQRLRAQLNP